MTMRAGLRGVDIEYELAGSGPRLIWGHGLTSSRADEDLPPVLIDWHQVAGRVEVLRYDARGHGRSGYSEEPSTYAWDQLARDQLALADSLGWERFAVGGASMGAATALWSAVLAPERIEALVLVIPPTAWETRADQTGMYRQMADIVETKGVELLVSAGAALPPPDPFDRRPEFKQRSAARLRAADPGRLAGVFRGAATADLPNRDDLAVLAAPTLILAWTGDAAHPVSTARLLAETIADAELSVASTWDELGTWTARTTAFLAG